MTPQDLVRHLTLLILGALELLSASFTGVVGQSATLRASASGTAPFSYQWYKGTTAINGATGSSYAIAKLASSDAADYKVKVSNTAGSAISAPSTLMVSLTAIAPKITTQPASLAGVVGKAVALKVVCSGTAPLSFQWKKAGVAIVGAKADTYTIASFSSAQAGVYSVTISNPAGTVTSANATLSVLAPPSITTQPASLKVNVGKPAVLSVTCSGAAPLAYQWKKAGVVLAGATAATYTLASATAASAGVYTVTISNAAGSVTSANATLYVTLAPTITTQPASLIITTGKNALFTVAASSSVSLTYQWKKNGVAISGATGTSHAITGATSAAAGSYTVTATNSAGSSTSNAATLVVNAVPTYQRIATVSVRAVISTGMPSSIVGFTTAGTGTRRFLMRGVGPSLSKYGTTGVLAAPKLELRTMVNGVDTLLATNTKWSNEPLAAAAHIESGAFALLPGSNDTALVRTLSPGAYTLVVTGLSGGTGTALVELYELP